jgi:hypothetical protein
MAESGVDSETNGLIVHGPVGNNSGKWSKAKEKDGGPGRTRTSDQGIMSPLL